MSSSFIQRLRPLVGSFSNFNKVNSKSCLPLINHCCKNLHLTTKETAKVVPNLTIDPKEKESMFAREPESLDFVDVQEIVASDETLQSPDYFQVHNLFTVRDLFDARVHLGHKIGSLNPHMKPFIYGHRFDTIIFDLDKTAFHLRQALNFIAHIAYRKGIILFISRSSSTLNLVEKTAIEVGEYAHCRKWSPAILTNSTMKFSGMTRLPDLIILLNTLDTVLAEHGAVGHAAKMLIPTVGVVDSNCEPNLITYPVPGNDDSIVSVEFYLRMFKEAIMRGKNRRRLQDSKDKEK